MTKLSKAYFEFQARVGARARRPGRRRRPRAARSAPRRGSPRLDRDRRRQMRVDQLGVDDDAEGRRGSASTCARASMMGPRRRLLSVSAVSGFGDRGERSAHHALRHGEAQKPLLPSCGVTRSSPSRCSSTDVHTGTSGTSCCDIEPPVDNYPSHGNQGPRRAKSTVVPGRVSLPPVIHRRWIMACSPRLPHRWFEVSAFSTYS